jgi:hypothetical protein
MPPPDEHLPALPTAAWQGLEAALRAFEDAWRKGTPPDLSEFLPPQPAQRLEVLVDLVTPIWNGGSGLAWAPAPRTTWAASLNWPSRPWPWR